MSTKECIQYEKISPSAIRDIDFGAEADAVVVNSGDRCVRVYGIDVETNEFDLHHKFQDVVNSNQWSGAALSRNGDYIVAGVQSTHKSAHAIHIWDRATGHLIKILQGPKDALETLDVRFICAIVLCSMNF